MNKKLLLGLTLTTGLALGAVASTTAHADELTNKAGISFDYNTPGTGPFQGNLAIAYVPPKFDFGQHNATGVTNAKIYNQVLPKGSEGDKQYIAVSDDRLAKTDNWNLTAKVDEFIYTEKIKDQPDKEFTLESAELAFVLGETEKYNILVAESDTNNAPTPGISTEGAISPLPDGHDVFYDKSPAANSKTTLIAGGAEVKVLDYTAPNQAPGAGTLAVAREVSAVTLKVLDHSEVAKKTFNSTVHWVLTADVATAP